MHRFVLFQLFINAFVSQVNLYLSETLKCANHECQETLSKAKGIDEWSPPEISEELSSIFLSISLDTELTVYSKSCGQLDSRDLWFGVNERGYSGCFPFDVVTETFKEDINPVFSVKFYDALQEEESFYQSVTAAVKEFNIASLKNEGTEAEN